jgi:hypothetical protein
MRKINYNLAVRRKIDGRAFAMTLGVLVLALVLFNAVTLWNLARLQGQSRAEKMAIGSLSQRMAALSQRTQEQRNRITAWQKTWNPQLAYANALIMRKCFSYCARLDFLERTCGAGMRVLKLTIVNEAAGRITIAVSARAQNQLIALYKKLLPYNVVIAQENQNAESYQANLNFRMEDEKK